MNWYLTWHCTRPSCENRPSLIRLMSHTKYNFIYPMALCYECAEFLQLADSDVGRKRNAV